MLIDTLWDIVHSYLPPDECQMLKSQKEECVAFTKRQYWKTNDPGWVLLNIFHYDISLIEPLYFDGFIKQQEYFIYLCHERLDEQLVSYLNLVRPDEIKIPFALIIQAPIELLTFLIDHWEWVARQIATEAPAANRLDVMQHLFKTTCYYRGDFEVLLSQETSPTILDMIYSTRTDKLAFLKQVMQENGNVHWTLTKIDNIDCLNVDLSELVHPNLLFTDLHCFQWFIQTIDFHIDDIIDCLSKECMAYVLNSNSLKPHYKTLLETGCMNRDLKLIEYALPHSNFKTEEFQAASCVFDDVDYFIELRRHYPSLLNDIPLDIVSKRCAFRILHLLMQERQLDIFTLKVNYELQPQDIAEYHIVDDVFLPHCTDLNKMHRLMDYMATFLFESRYKNTFLWEERFFEKHFFICIAYASMFCGEWFDYLHIIYPLYPQQWELVLDYLDEPFRNYVISGDPSLLKTKRQNRKRSLVL